jgi:hypothetical protein
MPPSVNPARRLGNLLPRRALLVLGAAFGLAACDPGGFAGPSQRVDASAPVTVALLVPSGSSDQGRTVLANSLENAARLAVAGLDGVQIEASYRRGERSSAPGGLTHRWMIKGVIVLAFAYIGLAAFARLTRVSSYLFNFPRARDAR